VEVPQYYDQHTSVEHVLRKIGTSVWRATRDEVAGSIDHTSILLDYA
jgi:hypothetical protein